jgi:hypothetical protein
MTKAMHWLLIEEKSIEKEFAERYSNPHEFKIMLELSRGYQAIQTLKDVYGY